MLKSPKSIFLEKFIADCNENKILKCELPYGDIILLLYHEDMMYVRELLFKNSQKEKTLKRFLEYC